MEKSTYWLSVRPPAPWRRVGENNVLLVLISGGGSALLQRAEEWAWEEGAKKVSLRVELDNPALEWYRRRGYRERAFILEKEL